MQFFLHALWNSVRSSGNTRTKVGQVPRLLVSVEYKEGEEFQYGMLTDYIQLTPANGKTEKNGLDQVIINWICHCFSNVSKPQQSRTSRIAYCVSPDLNLDPLPESWENLAYDDMTS